MTVCGGWSCVVMRYQRHQASTGHQSLSHTLTLHRSRSCHCHTTTISPAFCPLPDFRAYSVIGVNTGGDGEDASPRIRSGGRQCYSSPPRFWPVGHILCNESLSSADVPGLTYSSLPGSNFPLWDDTHYSLVPLRRTPL